MSDSFEIRKQEFIEELMRLGRKYDIALVGTCISESMYGEITFVDMLGDGPSRCGWVDVTKWLWNFDENGIPLFRL